MLWYGTPFSKGLGAGRHIEKTPVEALYGHGAYAAHAILRFHADPEALEAFRKPGKSLLYALGIGNQDILWQPQAKGRAPVVITGDVVVKAEALRALAHKACGNLANARAKGLKNKKIIFKHALRNALIPVITYLGPQIAFTLCGGFVVEKVFSIPGLGRYFISSIQNRDYPLIMGTTIFLAAFIIIMNLIVDLLYKLVDPRINLAKGGN